MGDETASIGRDDKPPVSSSAFGQLEAADVEARIWQRDHTVWKDDPTEITNRLGWLDVIDDMRQVAPELRRFATDVVSDGIRHTVLLGMGGSSLGPEVLRRTFGSATGYPELIVLDTTVPDAVLAVERRIDPARSLFLVSSKSGTTIEPLVLYARFRRFVEGALGSGEAGARFVAITDPGSPLGKMGADAGFRRVFASRPDIGGRYSVLSHFGLVPAALVGIDIERILAAAETARGRSKPGGEASESIGGQLGSYIADNAKDGRDKLSIIAGETFASLGLWVEQLIAESTGKEGGGVVPVAGEPLLPPRAYGADRAFVFVGSKGAADRHLAAAVDGLREAGHPVFSAVVDDAYGIGGLFFDWEFATAVVGAHLKINPFDQPNVQAAKDATDQVLGQFERSGRLSPLASVGSLQELLSRAGQGDYLAIMPFVAESPELNGRFHALRRRVAEKNRIATTLGYGPRFLHSTGQLHKGGPNSGLYLQITQRHGEDAEIPGYPYPFGTLVDAQAIGDFEALSAASRRVARLHVEGDLVAAIDALVESV